MRMWKQRDTARSGSISHPPVLLLILLTAKGGLLTDASDTTTAAAASLPTNSVPTPNIPTTHTNHGTSGTSGTPSHNCTSIGQRSNLPCQQHGCFNKDNIKSGDAAANALEPCLTGNHRVIQSKGDYSKYTFSDRSVALDDLSLPTNTWLLFKSADGNCMNMMAADESSCIMPGFCYSQFPWYLRRKPNICEGEEEENELCMTDVTNRNTAICCQRPIKMMVRSCGYYFLHKITGKMPRSSSGHVCTHEISASNAKQTVAMLNAGFTIDHGKLLPKPLNALTDEEQENLITAVFKLMIPKKANVRELIADFNKMLAKTLNAKVKRRAKRWGQNRVPQLTATNIKTVLGSPKITNDFDLKSTSQLLYYTVYAQTDTNEIIPQSDLQVSANNIPNTDFSHHFAYMDGVMKGLPQKFSYPHENITLTTTPPPKAKVSTKEHRKDWMIIIYIVIFTCAVIIVSFLALAIYRMKLVQRLRANRSRQLSKLERCLLCENYSSEDHHDGLVPRPDTPVLLKNGNCNGKNDGLSEDHPVPLTNSNNTTHITKPVDTVPQC